MKHLLSLSTLLLTAVLLLACGEDRSSEQPFTPTVQSLQAVVLTDSAALTGCVTASPNSSLLECGFDYGNDTLRAKAIAPTPDATFTAVTDSLGAGHYYAVAFAKNGVGTSHGDTIYFTIP